MQEHYAYRSAHARAKATISVVDGYPNSQHSSGMLGTVELLEELKRRGVRHADMSRALKLPTSRIAEMYCGKRNVRLDEAKTLVEAFDLDDGERVPPISEETARLLILHVANELGSPLSPDDDQVAELALDFQAFSKFARAHRPAPSPDATSGFLYARRTGRSPLRR